MAARRFGGLGRLAAAGGAAMSLVITLMPGAALAGTATAVAQNPSASRRAALDAGKLRATLDATHKAGMYGIYSSVRDDGRAWKGASGVANVQTGRPVTPDMQHRVGSVTKTFTAAAVLRQVEQGRIQLDAPIGTYLPEDVPGQRGRQITVRMLLNHTSGIADYVASAFPSLQEPSSRSLDRKRFRTLTPARLIKWGLDAPSTGTPGAQWSYSNTNYIILGRLLEKVTGMKAETYITRDVIRRAGLKNTYFPDSPVIYGAHSRMYESLYGVLTPPRDYSIFDMSWAGTAGALVSTMDDLNRFYRRLLTGGIVGPAALAEMRRTVPVKDADGTVLMNYGLGLYSVQLPCGTFWGHDGAVWGAGTQALTDEGGGRQLAFGFNLMKYQQLNGEGRPMPHPIDNAMGAHMMEALCGAGTPPPNARIAQRPVQPLPLQTLAPQEGGS
ncbi:serine hydrolase domain-containing protein [Actinomadura keratinilytica]|uniref:Serine hydrolase domain-containing protein n=2 Tax=Actinomadura keratinilytica TaxID=547461 RepID=A0ABP7YE51_9ACTN